MANGVNALRPGNLFKLVAGVPTVLSAGDKQLAVIFHLPKALSEAKGIALKEWVAAVLAPVEGATVLEEGEEVVKAVSPANTEASAMPPPLYGTCVNFTPAIDANSSAAT